MSQANPIGTCVENVQSASPSVLTVELKTTAQFGCLDKLAGGALGTRLRSLPICKYTWGADMGQTAESVKSRGPKPRPDEARLMRRLFLTDPLYQPTDSERRMIYKYRYLYMGEPRALPKLMLSIDWLDPDMIREARRMLKLWAPLSPTLALTLLDARYADIPVREYAVSRPVTSTPSIQKGTRVLISLWDSLMFGRVLKKYYDLLSTHPNISESHSEISTRVPFCIAIAGHSLTVDGHPVVDMWRQRQTTRQSRLTLAYGHHSIRLEPGCCKQGGSLAFESSSTKLKNTIIFITYYIILYYIYEYIVHECVCL